MKKIVFVLFTVLPLWAFAQKKDIQKIAFEVDGVCGMCKARIEKTAYKVKGVKTATWEIATHQLTLLLDTNKVSVEKVQEAIANAGHDTPTAKAPDEVYENLPLCCLYDRKTKKE